MSVSTEVALFAGYATALLVFAAVLDRLAQHSNARADRYRTAGFRYHPDHDAWACPEEQMLWPTLFDEKQQLMYYRAKPSVCNACPVKATCTNSLHGREITRPIQPWPYSEAARFHRGLVLVLVALAALLLLVTVGRHHRLIDLAVLAAPLVGCAVLAQRFTEHFRRTPTGFPQATAAAGLSVTRTTRTTWGTDHEDVS
ncbi:MAG: hypothetical protein ABI360_05215 [Allobranchiibius sp.]